MLRGGDEHNLHPEMLDHHSLAKQATVCYTAPPRRAVLPHVTPTRLRARHPTKATPLFPYMLVLPGARSLRCERVVLRLTAHSRWSCAVLFQECNEVLQGWNEGCRMDELNRYVFALAGARPVDLVERAKEAFYIWHYATFVLH
jgi:hypothetical protein